MDTQLAYIGLVVLGALISFGYGWAVSGEAFDWRKAVRTGSAAVVASLLAYIAAPMAGPVTPQSALAAATFGFGAAKAVDGAKDVVKARIA